MRYASTRLAVVSSLTFFMVWILSSLAKALAETMDAASAVMSVQSLAWTYYLPLFGFLGIMIFGMAEHFVPLFAGRELLSERMALVQVALADVAVVLVLLLPREWLVAGLAIWTLSAALFAGLILGTLRRPTIAVRPMEARKEFRAADRLAIPMTASAILYLLAASVGFTLATQPFAASYWFSFLHLYTLGFVALIVFGVGLHLLPRFLDAVPPRSLVRALPVLAVPAPAGVALGMPFLSSLGDPMRYVFVLSAIAGATAAVLFGATVVLVWRRSRKRRPASVFNVLAGLWLVLGVGFGVLFALAPEDTLFWAPAHGWTNLLGFAGFSVFGVTHEVLPPYASRGLHAIRLAGRAHAVLATAGLALLLVSYDARIRGPTAIGEAGTLLGLALLAGMAVSYAVGTVVTLRGISPRRRRAAA